MIPLREMQMKTAAYDSLSEPETFAEMSDEEAALAQAERMVRVGAVQAELQGAPLTPQEARYAAAAILDVRDQVQARQAFEKALRDCLPGILRSEVQIVSNARGYGMLQIGSVSVRAESGDLGAALEMAVLNQASKLCPQSKVLAYSKLESSSTEPLDVAAICPDLWKSAVSRLEKSQARLRLMQLADYVDGEAAALSGMSKQEFVEMMGLAWDRALIASVQEEDLKDVRGEDKAEKKEMRKPHLLGRKL